MSFVLSNTNGAVSSKTASSNGITSEGLHSRLKRFCRLRDTRMSGKSDGSEAVILQSFHQVHPDEIPQKLKERVDSRINGDASTSSERILGPTGTIRGVKNIVKCCKESLRVSAERDFAEGDEEEGKIIIYTTSMGGVRSKENECRFVINIFDNLGLKYDVRDIFMHKEYQKELDARTDVSGALVPQVFVNGVFLGGVKELEHLNETEQLKSLLSDFEKRNGHVCQTCGGFRYVNCPNCHGSKKARTTRISREISMLRCTACNENGLQRCPDCSP